jgi:putative intracellular protease/amidase
METDVPTMRQFRDQLVRPGSNPFKVAILVGPGFIPMGMVGVQTVLGMMPGAELHLVWKTRDLVEGFPNWWTKPTTAFADCPDDLDVIAVPMMPPEIQSDPEVVAFVADHARTARFVLGVCNGVLLLAAAGILRGKRVTASYNALPLLSELGAAEIVPSGNGVVADGNLYTAGPGNGSFEAALLIAERVFGKDVAAFAELAVEYDPHPPFGTGNAGKADAVYIKWLKEIEAHMIPLYRAGIAAALKKGADHGDHN